MNRGQNHVSGSRDSFVRRSMRAALPPGSAVWFFARRKYSEAFSISRSFAR
jgi:hypothetical protein